MFPLVPPQKSASAAGRATAGSLLAERAPGLKEGVERLVAQVVKNLQTMAGTTTTIEGAMAGSALEPLRDVVAAHPVEAVAGLIECAEIGAKILVTLNGRLVHSVVELLAGGNGAEAAPETPRPATAIDHQFALILVTLAAAAVQSEWADLGFGPARAGQDRGRARRRPSRRADRGCGGRARHHRRLRPARHPAAGAAAGGTGPLPPRRDHRRAAGGRSRMARRLQREIGRASITLDAYLDAKAVPLSSLAALQVGQILALPGDARARVSLVCDGRTYYRGEVGQDDGRYSLRIEDIVAEPVAAAVTLGARRHPFTDLSRA